MKSLPCIAFLGCLVLGIFTSASASPEKSTTNVVEPLVRAVDLNVGQEAAVELCDGSTAVVKLLDVKERRDPIRHALREAAVTVEVDGRPITLICGNYGLPQTFGRVQIDCPITKGYVQKDSNPWSLERDARLRLWPKGSPWIRPGTFGYPLRQRWLAGQSQMCNELADSELIFSNKKKNKRKYYHWGLDFGGVEGLDEVLSATDGTVISVGNARLEGLWPAMLKPRADVIYIRDERGWYYRYAHLDSFDPTVQLGATVKLGQKIGTLGKKGTSGGWAHLHFDVNRPQPDGQYGIDDAYCFAWQAYQAEHPMPLAAVARPHLLATIGDDVALDASRSQGRGLRFEWTLTDSTKAEGPKVVHRYDRPGEYSEIVKVADADGRIDYDFAVVVVLPADKPWNRPPSVHAAYWPTLGVKPGDRVTFKAVTRYLNNGEGSETWDFGDGSPTATTQSKSDPATYAETTHAYAKPGDYLVSVRRTNQRGETATCRLKVRVEKE